MRENHFKKILSAHSRMVKALADLIALDKYADEYISVLEDNLRRSAMKNVREADSLLQKIIDVQPMMREIDEVDFEDIIDDTLKD